MKMKRNDDEDGDASNIMLVIISDKSRLYFKTSQSSFFAI